jgi:two-component system NtrC family response regulator
VLLAHAFMRRFAQENKRGSMTFTDDALRAIEAHAWPGNVRELQSAVRRAVIMADGQRVTSEDLGLVDPQAGAAPDAVAADLDLRTVREAAERQAVLAALARTDSNVAKAAELLGVSRPTLYDLMSRLAIRQHTQT